MKNGKTYAWLILTYVAMQIGSVFLSPFLIQYFKGDPGLTLQEAQYHGFAWSLFISNVLAAIVFYLIVFRKKNFFQVFKEKPTSIGYTILWGVLGFFLALFGQMIAGMIESAIGIQPGSENTAFLSDLAIASPVIIISIVIFAPLLEEMIFRRVLFGGLYRKTNFILATLISALIFAAVHGELQHILIYTAPALVFSFIYYKTRRLLAPIIAHLMMNGFVMIIQLNAGKIDAYLKRLEELKNLQQSFISLFQ